MRRHIKGITLIEMVAVIVVVGVAIPPLMLMWQNVAYSSVRSATIAQAAFYAQELIEEIKSKEFVDPEEAGDTNLGPNTGENNRTDFDDVDDFAGYSDDPPSGYTWTVTVIYLDPNISDGGSWQELSGGNSDFKQIKVEVFHPLGNAYLVTMVSKF